ncbi:MAG: hypothetical protein M5R41_07555 [Bacteroidia bacterium]|nr:hypothetical protein [Bacteroidia bacterium]
MKRLKELSTRRVREYDYSKLSKHLVVFKTRKNAEILGTTKDGITTLSDAGRAFLDVLGQALQNFPCIRLHELSIRPSEVELALEITEVRNPRKAPPEGSDEWIYYRRIMTLPEFMGYLKMNSAHRINALSGKGGGEVWARRYASCVLEDEVVLARVYAELREEWSHVVVDPAQQTKKGKQASTLADVLASEFGGTGALSVYGSKGRAVSGQLAGAMLLGRVLLLTGARRDEAVRTASKKGVARGGGAGGMAGGRGSVVRNLGPARIFLSE